MTRRFFIGSSLCASASTLLGKPIRSSLGSLSIGSSSEHIPFDAHVLWLEMGGTTFINTGIIADSNLNVIFRLLKIRSSGMPCFGAYNNTNGRILRYHADLVNNYFDVYYGNNNTLYQLQDSWSNVGEVSILPSNGIATFNSKSKALPSIKFSTELEFYIGLRNLNGKAQAVASEATRFYYAWVSNGVQTMALIPVRFTNEYGETEGAMYDQISGGLFRNQGTGSFIIGPDI